MRRLINSVAVLGALGALSFVGYRLYDEHKHLNESQRPHLSHSEIVGRPFSLTEYFPRTVIARPFPAIKHLPLSTPDEIQDEVEDNELVLGAVIGGQARAYPINQLTGPEREIFNDTLGGRAIAATW